MRNKLADQVRQSCRHLLSEINRDPASPTQGCCDRRYWAWKLVDFPEATYQRNLANLAWYSENGGHSMDRHLVKDAVTAGLRYTARIQHRNGSFDQAFPYERSFGATGFLLPDLVKAYLNIRDHCPQEDKILIEKMLHRAADFLTRNKEQHGLISNHLAGAALGLKLAADLFHERVYETQFRQLVAIILKNQSSEGWFPEYGGADPGYQTLCVHYLAQIYHAEASPELKKGLQSSLEFLQFFAHPDGSFGGEYGSRRTEVYYPGGIALLADEFPLAATIDFYMRRSIEEQSTVTLVDIDMGNIAPLLSSMILALDTNPPNMGAGRMPCEEYETDVFFQEAGLAVKANESYYAILGISNGAVLKVFDRHSRQLVFDDCGALAQVASGKMASTQHSTTDRSVSRDDDGYKCESAFFEVAHFQPNPFNMLVLRMMNLTIMRVDFLNEWIKKVLVKRLVKPSRKYSLFRKREITFSAKEIRINDIFHRASKVKINWFIQGKKFSSVHMASAGYFAPAQLNARESQFLNQGELNEKGVLEKETRLVF